MKDHEIRELVSTLTKIAEDYGQTQQLREHIRGAVFSAIPPSFLASSSTASDSEPPSFLKWCKENGRMPTDQNEAAWKANIAVEELSFDRLETLERICEGITDEMIEGGWTARGLSKHAKELEDRIASVSEPDNSQAVSFDQAYAIANGPRVVELDDFREGWDAALRNSQAVAPDRKEIL